MPQVKIDIYDDSGVYQGTLDVHDHETFPLAVTQSITDMRDITTRSGTSTKSFRILATGNNNRILKHIYNANVDANAVVYGYTASVFVDGLPALQAKLKIKQVFQYNAPAEYELELLGDNLEWVYLMKDLKITDLRFGYRAVNGFTGQTVTNASFAAENDVLTLDTAHVEATWETSYNNGFEVLYSLKDYGQFANPTSVQITEMRPDVYVKAIIDKAFAKIGYQFVSTFFNTDFCKRLVIPFFGNNWKATNNHDMDFSTGLLNTPAVVNLYDDSGYPRSGSRPNPRPANYDSDWNYHNDLQITGINLGVGTQLANNGIQFKHGVRGTVKVTAVLTNVGYPGGYISVKRNGVEIHQMPFTGSHSTLSQTHVVPWSFNDVFKPNEYLTLSYVLHSRVLNNSYDNSVTFLHTNGTDVSGISFTSDDVIVDGCQFRLSKVLPELNCLDVINGMTNMFNLYFRTDAVNKTVYCEPRTGFYKSVLDGFDWSNKLDVSQEITTEFINTYARTMNFQFVNDDKDSLVKSWDDAHHAIAGSLQYDLPSRFPVGSQEIGSKVYSFTLFQNQVGSPVFYFAGIPTFWTGDGQPPAITYDFKPRILYYPGLADVSGALQYWRWYNGTVVQKFPVATLGNSDLQLNYNGTNGLVANFYQGDIATIIEGKIITAFFNLSPMDMLKLDLSKPIHISHHNLNGFYYINQVIDYQPNKRTSTKVELIRVNAESLGNAPIDYSNTIDYSEARLGVGIGPGAGAAPINSNLQAAYTPAVVLQNNTGNWAGHNTGSVALGQGLVALGNNQHLSGRYNVASNDDIFQVGVGASPADRYRGLTFTNDGNFLVQGGYMYTSDGQAVLFASQRNNAGQPTRFDNLHIQGNH